MIEKVALPREQMQYAEWTQRIQPSTLQTMLVEASRPDVLSFALGLPAADLFPTEQFEEATVAVLATDPNALQYGPPRQSLKQHIVQLMQLRGVTCKEEQVFITSGAQQGLNLLIHLLLDPGAQVLTEEITYTGFQQLAQLYCNDILTVPTDAKTGIDVDAVQKLLSRGIRPRLLYVMPSGHNPLGIEISEPKRRRLAELARRYAIPIIEDDPYGFIYYQDKPMLPLRAFDDEWVLYVGTFSKILAPTVRTGWIIAPEALIPKLAILKEISDINTGTFAQRCVTKYLDMGYQSEHLARLRYEYSKRRSAMLEALACYFPQEARWEEPQSGFFVWVELPTTIDSLDLLKIALEKEKIAFIPSHTFSAKACQPVKNGMRLNFSNCGPEQIEMGISRLGRIVKSIVA